jgi:hypothetical protein
MPEEEFQQAVEAKRAAIQTPPPPKPKRARKPKPESYYTQKRVEGFVNHVDYLCRAVDHAPEIPKGLTAETAAKLLPDVRAAIRNASRNLRKLEAALVEIADGGGEVVPGRVLQ